MEKPKPTYWAVYREKAVLFDGSFTQCWDYLCDNFMHCTIRELQNADIRIARKS